MATGPASSTFTFLESFEEMQSTDPGHFELPLNVEQNRPGYPDHQSGLRLNGVSAPPCCTDDCDVLREITHTKGMHVKTLQIHGRLDLRVFAHAIVEECDLLFPIEHQCQLTDFQNGSYELVNNFLVEYLETCAQEGYHLQRDHPSNFYDTLSVGLNDLPSSPEKTGGSNQGPGRFNKKYSLKEQRERISKIKAAEFKELIHLPMQTAAREMNMCITTMHKICDKRWPYRKVKSLERKIAKNREVFEFGDEAKKAAASAEIQKYEQELAKIKEAYT